jgi:hypothetical protein
MDRLYAGPFLLNAGLLLPFAIEWPHGIGEVAPFIFHPNKKTEI